MLQPRKHHYIPAFYLTPWAGANGNLCEYSRPYKRVATKWRHPNAAGFQKNLYTMPLLPAKDAQIIETQLMGLTDHWASRAQQVLLSWGPSGVQSLSEDEHFGWARFLYALIIRTPEQIERLRSRMLTKLPEFIETKRADYLARRGPNDPATFDEFKERYLSNPANRDPLQLLPRLLNSEFTLTKIAEMKFRTIKLIQHTGYTFLTSDRPFIMTNGLAQADGHIALPLSPTTLFIAEKADLIYKQLVAGTPRKLVTTVNTIVAEQSHKYV